jgi:deaminated glutathione amidase
MRVAVCQFASVADSRTNLERSMAMAKAAGSDGAELVVLPEAAMYPFVTDPEELAEAAETLDGPYVSGLATVAAEQGVHVVAGMFERVPGERRVHNTVVAVGPDGLEGQYRKLHLFDALGRKESDSLVPGAIDGGELLLLHLGEMVVGVVTCYDLRFPELFRVLVDRGATAFAVPAAWVAGPLKEEHWLTMCRARAIENTSYLLGAAQPPPEYSGRSVVFDPMGVALAGLGEGDGTAHGELFAERVRSVRTALPVLAQRRYEVRPRT